MSPPESSLDDLRAEIDGIDDAIHDLLMRRAGLVDRISLAKPKGGSALRPAREAAVIRRLLSRHDGAFPRSSLVRVWREVMSAFTRMQGNFAVAVFMPEHDSGFWDVARDQYGSVTPMVPFRSPLQVIRAVTEDRASVGVLPVPGEDDSDPWWPALTAGDARSPRIVSRLPFGARGNVRGDAVSAVAIARLPYEPTGDDRTFLVLDTQAQVSRARLLDDMAACGLEPGFCSVWRDERRGDHGSSHLVDVAGFVAPDDPRLAALLARAHDSMLRVVPVGGYAVPLRSEELDG